MTKKQISVIDSCGDSSWIKGRRCLVKKTDAGVAICYLDENNSELFHDGKKLKHWLVMPEVRYWTTIDGVRQLYRRIECKMCFEVIEKLKGL